MKKILPLAVFLFVILAPQTFGQTDTMLNLNRYSTYILDRNNRLDLDYELASTDFDYYNLVAALGGNSQTLVDTPLEIALLSNSAGVIDIRPAEANAILPANNPRQADLKLGAAVLQELQVLRFLGDTAAAGRHEAVLQFITGRGNATRAEVEAFYRNGIRGLISATVDEEFNKISFLLRGGPRGSYGAMLTRNNNGGYALSYEDANDVTKTLSAQTLEALLAEMRRSTTDFDERAINTVRTQAALIPAVAYGSVEIQAVIGDISNFFLNPNNSTFENLVRRHRSFPASAQGNFASTSFLRTIISFNEAIARRVLDR